MDDNDKNYNYSIEIGQIYKSFGLGHFELQEGNVILKWVSWAFAAPWVFQGLQMQVKGGNGRIGKVYRNEGKVYRKGMRFNKSR